MQTKLLAVRLVGGGLPPVPVTGQEGVVNCGAVDGDASVSGAGVPSFVGGGAAVVSGRAVSGRWRVLGCFAGI